MTTPPTDADRTSRMQAIYSALTRALASDPDVTIDLLPEHQLFVSKHIVDASGPQTGKSPRRVPSGDGYTIYVRVGSADSGGRPRQRSTQPADSVASDVAATRLKLDRTALDQSWQLRSAAGELIIVTVRCGSARVFDEVDRVLDTLGRALAAQQGSHRS